MGTTCLECPVLSEYNKHPGVRPRHGLLGLWMTTRGGGFRHGACIGVVMCGTAATMLLEPFSTQVAMHFRSLQHSILRGMSSGFDPNLLYSVLMVQYDTPSRSFS